ncbi:DMT family protein [Terriglobus saanensis]|uniref:Small multidrug resistance protein n=1 Tax=Terriglobus saanensis (strain ATCC BAA-1853 / DSM 23119 / SP1PR4) TaxID=401053 RepID=E8UXU2_TERSS|nr:DMT family protein [Terriglobus saanensis]ADV83108.1 small multidrug resistance protein [Terriglobus saanensis SP1PR4]
MKRIFVPILMLASSTLMATAWLGHLRFRNSIGFWMALGASWLLVLPEYVLNVGATRFGYGTYSGAQMASFHLAGGVICVALISHYLLGERLGAIQLFGFVLLAVAMVLIMYRPSMG